jgi:hypothetical protein
VRSKQIIVDGQPRQAIALLAPTDVAQASWLWRMIDRW